MSDSEDDGLRAAFPYLGEFDVTSPRDMTYNCIAWAVGRDDAWLWPDKAGTASWPEGVVREESLSAFVAAFEALGYTVCESEQLESGFAKIALFEHDGKPSHAARQLESGKWTSKCGQSVDIAHELHELEGALYGRVAIVMAKKPDIESQD